MNLNFKLLFKLIVFLIYGNNLFAQSSEGELDSAVLGEIGIAYALPQTYGANFLDKGYQVKNGYNIGILLRISPKLLVGAQHSSFDTKIIDPATIGQIDATKIAHLHVIGGYIIPLKQSKISLKTGLGIGYAWYTHKQMRTKFKDDAFSMDANVSFNYRINNFVGLYFKIDNYLDFMNIDTAPEQIGLFRKAQLLIPSIGFNIFTF